MIQLINVTKRYDNGRGVSELTFEISDGIVGFLGRNGAGKTTTINLIMGFLEPDSGSVLINGKNLWKYDNMSTSKRNIGYLPNDTYLYEKLTGKENLEYMSILKTKDKHNYKNYTEYMRELDVLSFIDEPFHSYSTGMKKKLQLICSLIGNPEILVYDEPNNGLDIIANNALEKMLLDLKERGRLIFLSSHIIEIVQKITDEVIIIEEGRIIGTIKSPYREDLMKHYLDLLSSCHEKQE